MLLGLCLSWRELLHTWRRVEDGTEEVDYVSLLLIVLIKALEEVCLMIAPEQTFDLIYGAFGQLGHELLPVSVFDL